MFRPAPWCRVCVMRVKPVYFRRSLMTRYLPILRCLPILWLLASSAHGEDAAGVGRRLLKSMTQSGPLSYTFDYRGEGALAGALAPARGTVLIEPLDGAQLGRYRRAHIRGQRTLTSQDGTRTQDVDIVVTGGDVYTFDHAEKRVWHNPAYRVGLDNEDRRVLLPIEGLAWLAEALGELELEGTETVAGELCRVLRFQVDSGYDVRAWVGREDALLYRLATTREDWGGWDGGAAVIEIRITPVGKTDADDFPTRAEGYASAEYTGPFPAIGQPAPDWTLETLNGTALSLAELEGRVVVMDFFASWCLPCYKILPLMEQLHERFKAQPVTILGLTWSEGDPEGFVERNDVSYPVARGDHLAEAYQLEESGLPIVYVIGPNGRLVDFFRDADAVTQRLEALIVRQLGAR